MKSCPDCLQTHECAKEYSYRTAPPREEAKVPVVKLSIKDRYPKLYAVSSVISKIVGRSMAGILVLGLLLAIGWVLTVGIYRLGIFVIDNLLYWNLNNIDRVPAGWFLGAGLFIVPIITYFTGKLALSAKD